MNRLDELLASWDSEMADGMFPGEDDSVELVALLRARAVAAEQALAEVRAQLERAVTEANKALVSAVRWEGRADKVDMSLTVALARLAQIEALFNGGPDTSCRTVWQDGIECVSVPLADLAAALDGPAERATDEPRLAMRSYGRENDDEVLNPAAVGVPTQPAEVNR